VTVTISVATSQFLILAADAAVTLDFGDWREYETGPKLHRNDAAVVTTWGARDANEIAHFVRRPSSAGLLADVLAKELFTYLRAEYDPRAMGLGTIGYHVGGFDSTGRARLFHVFYEPDGYNETTPPGGLYELQDQSPTQERPRVFLYNGRSDLAHSAVSSLLSQVRNGLASKFDVSSFPDMWRFAHLVLRFAAELTPEVGPPFVISGTTSHRAVARRVYRDWEPCSPENAEEVAAELRVPSSAV
jgi:hypothetical protein